MASENFFVQLLLPCIMGKQDMFGLILGIFKPDFDGTDMLLAREGGNMDITQRQGYWSLTWVGKYIDMDTHKCQSLT